MCQLSFTVLIPMSVVSMAVGLALLIAGIVAGAIKVPDSCDTIMASYNSKVGKFYNSGYDNGYNLGFNTGYNTGYNSGYNRGYNSGYLGYNTGYGGGSDYVTSYTFKPSDQSSSLTPVDYSPFSGYYSNAYGSGWNSGYNTGYAGFYQGFNMGFNEGYNTGHDSSQKHTSWNAGYYSGLFLSDNAISTVHPAYMEEYISKYNSGYQSRNQSTAYSPEQHNSFPFDDCSSQRAIAQNSILLAALLGCIPALLYIVSGALGFSAGIYRSKAAGGFHLAILILALVCSFMSLILLPFTSLFAAIYYCGESDHLPITSAF